MKYLFFIALVVSSCASLQVPKDDVFEGYLREGSRGVFFIPCLEQDKFWRPSFNGMARDDYDRLTRLGVTKTPKGAYVKIYGTSTVYNENTGYEKISKLLQVTKIVHEAGKECAMGVK